jgi:glycosyltransferase involved in cell wall biosynthesis
MKIALVHDQLQEFGGAERVIVALKKIFPKADVFTAFYNFKTLGDHADEIKKWNIKPSWAHYVPLFKKFYSPLRFLAPKIWESFDFSKYDMVITSSGWYMCKGIRTSGKTKNICYLHHPPRYLYNYETAVEWQKYKIIKIYANFINHSLRIWDYLSSQRVNYFIANSYETKKRIKKFYRRESVVIYPPVDIPSDKDVILNPKSNYFITVSRLARAKHVDLLIKTANKMGFNLKIVGDGRDKERLKKISKRNIEILDNINDKKLKKLLRNAKAFIFASVDEEFGIAPVEAMGYGVPVIAYYSGGLKETVKEGYNGFLFKKLTSDDLIERIAKLNSLTKKKYIQMRKNARSESLKYSEKNFKKNILNFISKIKD